MGLALMDDEEILNLNYIKPVGLTLLDKYKSIRSPLRDMYDSYRVKPEVLVVESPVISMMNNSKSKGKTTAYILGQLMRWNGFAQAALFETFDVPIVEMTAPHARKLALGYAVVKGMRVKDAVFEAISEIYGVEWPTGMHGEPLMECYDMADAIILSRALFKKGKSLRDSLKESESEGMEG